MHIESLSNKQIECYQQSDARINIFEGPVRAGKSFICLLRWLEFCRSGPKGPLIICGRTEKTIKRNIILPLQELVGSAVKYSIGKGEVQLYGRIMYVVAANDERAEAKIRGSEFAGALIEELTLLPESFCKMLLSRLSIPKAQLFANTNPDSPYHWVKTDIIDRQHELNCKVFSFNIDDNPALDEDYKKELKKEYKGLWYKRYIEGLWVMAEGAVYDFFDEDTHVIPHPPGNAKYYLVGIDYGTTNPCVFTLLGYNDALYPNIWLEKEYYYDSRETQRQKSDYEYAIDFIDFIDGYRVDYIYIDPSAASFKQELRRNGINNIIDANNDVVPGIRFQGQLLSNGTYKICCNCTNVIKEYSNYVWDSKASAKGEDKPLKINDHCFASGTKIITSIGLCNIENIKIDDYVLTRRGYQKVIETFKHDSDIYEFDIFGKKINCTSDHKFLTFEGWKEAKNLLTSDMLFINCEYLPWLKQSNFKESNTDDIQNLKILATELISERTNRIVCKDTDIYTEMFGNSIMEKFQKDTIFITKTVINQTTTLAISNVYQLFNTFPIMQTILKQLAIKLKDTESNLLQLYKKKQKSGIEATREESGIHCTQKSSGKIKNQSLISVNNVINNSLQQQENQNFVRIVASQNGEEIVTLIMNIETAYFVINNFQQINIQKENIVINPVQKRIIGKKTVYNIHVENYHEYFAENILVKNCKDAERYVLFTHFFNKPRNAMTEDEALEMERRWYVGL